MSQRYKIDELVRVRDWDDMVRRYELRDDPARTFIVCPGAIVFLKEMKKFCGNTYRIHSINDDGNYLLYDKNGEILKNMKTLYCYNFSEAMLDPVVMIEQLAATTPTISFTDLFSVTP